MSWLLDDIWEKVWVDENITYCGSIQDINPDIESNVTDFQDLKPFLTFAKVWNSLITKNVNLLFLADWC